MVAGRASDLNLLLCSDKVSLLTMDHWTNGTMLLLNISHGVSWYPGWVELALKVGHVGVAFPMSGFPFVDFVW